jgi:hypothetical protein
MDPQVLQSLQTALGNTQAPNVAAMNPMSGAVQFNPSDFNVPDLNAYLKTAYDQLAPYYSKLLAQAQGDYGNAITMLQNHKSVADYQAQAEASLADYQQNQITQAALETLGAKIPQETQQLLDSMNKRGVAVTQGQPGANPTSLNVGTEGQGGTEMKQLSSDQTLRQEALNRSAQQAKQNTALTLQSKNQNAAQTLQEGTYAQQKSLRDTQQQEQQNLESGTMDLAKQQSANALAQQQLKMQAQQNMNQFGGGSGGDNTFNRAKNTGTLNGQTFTDINAWNKAGGNFANAN